MPVLNEFTPPQHSGVEETIKFNSFTVIGRRLIRPYLHLVRDGNLFTSPNSFESNDFLVCAQFLDLDWNLLTSSAGAESREFRLQLLDPAIIGFQRGVHRF